MHLVSLRDLKKALQRSFQSSKFCPFSTRTVAFSGVAAKMDDKMRDSDGGGDGDSDEELRD